MVNYRHIKFEELNSDLFSSFIRHQEVNLCYRQVNQQWVIQENPFIDDWSSQDLKQLLEEIKEIHRQGGLVEGAFIDGKLKGFVVVSSQLLNEHLDYADLVHLYVSKDYRGQKIGTQLFLIAQNYALTLGAKKLYISLHSALETQLFYRCLGCVEATFLSRFHIEKEPYDCQLEYTLKI